MKLGVIVQFAVISAWIILICMKRDSKDSADYQASSQAGHEGKFTAKKTGKHVGSAMPNAQQYMKDYNKTIQKNKETDWLNSNNQDYPNEPVPVKIEPKKECQLPPFWKNFATSNQNIQGGSEKQAQEKAKPTISDDQYKQKLRKARMNMNNITKEQEKEEEKIADKAKTSQQSAPKEVQQVNTPATRLANIPAIQANTNTFKPVASNPINNASQPSNTSLPFGQTQGFSFNSAVHNRQQGKPFANAALITPINPINAINSIIVNQPIVQQFNQNQPQPQPQIQPQARREQKAQSKFYNNPQWLNYRANLFQLLKNKSLNDRMLDILTVLTFPDPKYLNKEEIQQSYIQIIDFGSICYEAKEKKKQFLCKQSLCFSPLDKKKSGFELKDYLQSLKDVEPSKDFSSKSIYDRIDQQNMEQEVEPLCNLFEGMTIPSFFEMYVSQYSAFRDDLSYLTEKVVKTMQAKHKIDALLEELKEEQEEEQYDAMINRFERIKEKQESISTILSRITHSLHINVEELPKSVLNYEIEDLQAIEKEEEHLRGEIASWRDQLCESQQGQPYKKIINSFCECSIALVRRVEEIEARLNALSSSA